MARSAALKYALRRIEAKRRITDGGDVHYADVTPVGSVIDNTRGDRESAPLVLEHYIARIGVWQVCASFPEWEPALKHAKKAKDGRWFDNAQLRLRDRRTNDILLCDIL